MKTKYKILLIFGIILVLLFASYTISKIIFYETWLNKGQLYYHPNGYKVECEFGLFKIPIVCVAIWNEKIIDTKTWFNDWQNVRRYGVGLSNELDTILVKP